MSALEKMIKPMLDKLLSEFRPQIDSYIQFQKDQSERLERIEKQVNYIRLKLEENDPPPVTVVVDDGAGLSREQINGYGGKST